jgi:hypothetical protein
MGLALCWLYGHIKYTSAQALCFPPARLACCCRSCIIPGQPVRRPPFCRVCRFYRFCPPTLAQQTADMDTPLPRTSYSRRANAESDALCTPRSCRARDTGSLPLPLDLPFQELACVIHASRHRPSRTHYNMPVSYPPGMSPDHKQLPHFAF